MKPTFTIEAAKVMSEPDPEISRMLADCVSAASQHITYGRNVTLMIDGQPVAVMGYDLPFSPALRRAQAIARRAVATRAALRAAGRIRDGR